MTTPLDLSAARRRLASATGRRYWRSLEELAGTPGFVEMLHREFPRLASVWDDGVSRRRFLGLMGASLALAGLSGCAQRPAGKILPYVRQPEDLVPGKPLFYATAMSHAGYALGLLAESHEGRPTKVEGNPEHPVSRGATDIAAQASVLTMYDPDRAQAVTYRGRIRAWGDAVNELRARLRGTGNGKGVRILTEAVGSPTLARQLDDFLKRYPEARWHQYEPAAGDGALAGAQQAFGRPVHCLYRVARADVIVALDADFLHCGPASLMYTRDWAARRRRGEGAAAMNRLYVVECTPTNTGAVADNRLPLRASQVEAFARALAALLGVAGVEAPSLDREADRWARVIAADLKARPRGKTLVVPGDGQPAAVHVLAHAINDHLGNFGQTVLQSDPVGPRPTNNLEAIKGLADELGKGAVQTLFILGGNPVYTAPADLGFGELLERNAKKPDTLHIHLGLYFDETSRLCHWHVPEAHYLEAWGDGRAADGTASVVQPLIAPLYGGRSAHELLSALLSDEERTGYELVRDTWQEHWKRSGGSGDFEKYWEKAVHDGVIPGTAVEHKAVPLQGNWAQALGPAPAGPKDGEVELVLAPDPVLQDGRWANNGWLQELPRPITKLTWDNALLMSPATAQRLGVRDRVVPAEGGEHGASYASMVKLAVPTGQSLEVPVWVTPGHADGAVTLHLGHGRTHAGRVGNKVGFDANKLRTTAAPSVVRDVKIERTAGTYQLACTQEHFNIEGRRLIRHATAEEYKKDPGFAREEGEPPGVGSHDSQGTVPSTAPGRPDPGQHGKRRALTLYPEFEYAGHKWAMAIDLGTCVGCSACVVACQAENNIPVVGKEEVLRGREMHWLRVDRYYVSQTHADEGVQHDPGRPPVVPANPAVFFQPLPCMHCENAPCELVCPVEATVHSAEGTNDMVYNRCVGTRYCSNNCPYKVRRFNFLFYAKEIYETPSLKLLQNPDVTVRSRGVMEKCTYCVQRINFARIEAEKELVRELEEERKYGAAGRRNGPSRQDPNRPGVAVIHDGEVLTACQAVCPAGAIVFGDLNDPNSQVARLNQSELNYGLLTELNTRPRTTYLAAVRNPNPELLTPAEGT
jgi:molybdopterin-containing oxidoreductase family iron-sulfur binding subunit